jgi:glutathione-specific gamma-glutamylcyclotransferase
VKVSAAQFCDATSPSIADGLPDPMPPEIAALRDSTEPVWIFAYGSLMWDADFPRAETEPALLRGYHRSFCLYSYDYRGTRTRPGLTLGLDRGGACRGIALRLPPETLAEAVDRLWAREMTAPRVYDMRLLPVRTACGSRMAFAFTVRRDHADYAGRLSPEATARIIASAAGRRGVCRDYLTDTVNHLAGLGIADASLQRLTQRVEALGAATV